MRAMWRRITCGLLAMALLFTGLPAHAADALALEAAGAGSSVPGDANGDGILDARDIEALRQYIAENDPSGFQFTNADLTGDGAVDLKDLLELRKRLKDAGQTPGSGTEQEGELTVSFYDGDRLIGTLPAKKGEPLGRVPSVAQSSKENAILLGYFTDRACTTPFYAENPVTASMNVYASYQEMKAANEEELNFTSFAQMDQLPDLSFLIRQTKEGIAPENAAELVVKDGSDPVEITIEPSGGNGCYKVYAKDGFRKGCSYELNLAKGWVFVGGDGKDKPETIRTAAFSIEMKEVKNLKMSEDIIYIEDTGSINYTVNGEPVDGEPVAGKPLEKLEAKDVGKYGGSITYTDEDAGKFEEIEEGSILCVYVGTDPRKRDSKQGNQLLDPIVYVKAAEAPAGDQVKFLPLSAETDQAKLYDIPDNFPVALKVAVPNPTMDDSADKKNSVKDDTETEDGSGDAKDEDNTDGDGDSADGEGGSGGSSGDGSGGSSGDNSGGSSGDGSGGASGDNSGGTSGGGTGDTAGGGSGNTTGGGSNGTTGDGSNGTTGNGSNGTTGGGSNGTTGGGSNGTTGDSSGNTAGGATDGGSGNTAGGAGDSGSGSATSDGSGSASGDGAVQGIVSNGTVGKSGADAWKLFVKTADQPSPDTAGESGAGGDGSGNPAEEDSAETDGAETDGAPTEETPAEEDAVSGNSIDESADSGVTLGKKWSPDLESKTGTVLVADFLATLDLNMYNLMMGKSGLEKDDVEKKLSVGDFITLYQSSDEIQGEGSLTYVRITKIEGGTISYEKTDRKTILESMDVYDKATVGGKTLVTPEQTAEIEAQVLAQMEESGFAEEAAYALGEIVTETEEFKNSAAAQELLLADADAAPLSEEGISRSNIGKDFELSDGVKLKVELINSGDQLHYQDGGVQLAIQIVAELEKDTANGKVAFDLSATFVQEVAIAPSVRGGIVTKEILWIPIPIGVEVSAAIDIRNYTAFSFAAEIYTAEGEEEEGFLDKVQGICKDTTSLGLENLPENLKKGLETVGDAMGKIQEIQAKIDQASDTADKINGYRNDLDTLWNLVGKNNKEEMTREDWNAMRKELKATNVAADLMGMLNLTKDTEISTEYLKSMQDLMDKYSETIEKETDWVELVNKEIFSKEFYLGPTPFVVGTEVNFVVRADVSVAIGSNLEYEVGKRYNFWFKIGLFEPSAGSSTMDLLDESFAFQFYVMGRLGVKAGIRAKLYVGLGSGKFASAGIAAELGPYVKLYGFFVYEYAKKRQANTQIWTSKGRKAGALFLEFGLYVMVSFEANALGDLFEYSHDFVDEEIPLLEVGKPRYYYQSAYEPEEDELVFVRDVDNNSTNGITMRLPEHFLALAYMDLNTGAQGSEVLDYSNYNFTLSNPAFAIDKETGDITVTKPDGNVRLMECDLNVTYLHGKMAFSQYDMTATIPLAWTSLTEEEMNQFYTAAVQVGNGTDGYETVWRKRVRKNQQFKLPTDEEIKKLIGWNDAKYSAGTGYGSQTLENLTIYQDTTYTYNVAYKKYSLTVGDIEDKDGNKTSKTFTARYGERFNFSELEATGTEKPGVEYTKFAGVTTEAEIDITTVNEKGNRVPGKAKIDLTQPIVDKVAKAIAGGGVTATATYVKDGVEVEFKFMGITHEAVKRVIRKGTIPNLDEIEKIAEDESKDIVSITPTFDKVDAPTTFHVYCGELPGEKQTITFDANGGGNVESIQKAAGGLLVLPTPTREGYTFGGWYTDNGTFKNQFAAKKMPADGAVLYAKWTANQYEVRFDVNGGNALDEAEKTRDVTFGEKYGELPKPTRADYGFDGWYTENVGGTEVTADTLIAEASDHTLYAHWKGLKAIPAGTFDFGAAESVTYKKGEEKKAVYSFNAGAESFDESSFTIKYMRQGSTKYETGLPVNAGVYNVTVSRDADAVYAKFVQNYTEVLTIQKATRTVGAVKSQKPNPGLTFVEVEYEASATIDDLDPDAKYGCAVYKNVDDQTPLFWTEIQNGYIYDLAPGTNYIAMSVKGDQNYEDAESARVAVTAKAIPGKSWALLENCDTEWYTNNPSATEFSISTAAQLAGLAYLVWGGESGTSQTFAKKTIKLTQDVDLSEGRWMGIGISKSKAFEGTFDGGGHKIKGLYRVVTTSDGAAGGLFNIVAYGGMVKNVILEDSYLDFSNSSNSDVGGIVGSAEEAVRIENCVNYAVVRIRSGWAGGILGRVTWNSTYPVVITNCVNYGRISSTGDAGGIAGRIAGGKNKGEIYNCVNYGQVYGNSGSEKVGGIAGSVLNESKVSSTVSNNVNVGEVQALGSGGAYAIVGETGGVGVSQNYYLKGSASAAMSGSTSGSFTSATTAELPTNVTGMAQKATLIDALNNWVDTNKKGDPQYEALKWEAISDANPYPIPKGIKALAGWQRGQ